MNADCLNSNPHNGLVKMAHVDDSGGKPGSAASEILGVLGRVDGNPPVAALASQSDCGQWKQLVSKKNLKRV